MDGAGASVPKVVIVHYDETARHDVRKERRQALHGRFVPVAVQPQDRDRLFRDEPRQRVAEPALDQLEVLRRGHSHRALGVASLCPAVVEVAWRVLVHFPQERLLAVDLLWWWQPFKAVEEQVKPAR